MIAMDFDESLGTSEVLDTRRQGGPTEECKQYAARRSDRRQHSALDPATRGDDALMVDQGRDLVKKRNLCYFRAEQFCE